MEGLWNKSEPLNEIEYLVGFTKIISNLSTTTLYFCTYLEPQLDFLDILFSYVRDIF